MYTAQGRTKKEAKNLACELALKDYAKSQLMSDSGIPEKDMIIFNLASFAFHKLNEVCNRDGDDVSLLRSTSESALVCQGLPANWKNMHPASVLNIMRPTTKYISTQGNPNNGQSMSIVVDNQKFMACGRSKKIARRNVAIAALKALFNLHFEN